MGKTETYGIKARVFGTDHLKSLNLKVGDKLDFGRTDFKYLPIDSTLHQFTVFYEGKTLGYFRPREFSLPLHVEEGKGVIKDITYGYHGHNYIVMDVKLDKEIEEPQPKRKTSTPASRNVTFFDKAWFKKTIGRMNRIEKEHLLQMVYLEKQLAEDEKSHLEMKKFMNQIKNDPNYYDMVSVHIKQVRYFEQDAPRSTGTKLIDFVDHTAGNIFDLFFGSPKPKRPYTRRVTHCRSCGFTLDSAKHIRCRSCNWIKCPKCATCGC